MGGLAIMSKLILVIDDDADQRLFLDGVLSASGYRVAAATDGEAGLAAAASLSPDFIILDVRMPRLNGYQACRALKRNPVTAERPVLVLTSKDEPADAFWAREAGADAFLQKPVDVPQLLETISRLMDRA